MAARSGFGAPPRASWFCLRQPLRPDRRRRSSGPVLETLEGRRLLAGTTATNPVLVRTEAVGGPTQQQLGAAYHQVGAIQDRTLRSLGDSYRRVQAAGSQLAAQTAVAIDQLTAESSRGELPRHAIAAAIRRDRQLLNLGSAHVARAEQGLDVARGVEDQAANSDKIDISVHLYTGLATLVEQASTTGSALARSGQRQANSIVRIVDQLGHQLVSSV